MEGSSLEVVAHDSDDYMSEETESMAKISVNNAMVKEADITAPNGIVYIIDNVMTLSGVEVIGAAKNNSLK